MYQKQDSQKSANSENARLSRDKSNLMHLAIILNSAKKK